MGVAFLFTNLLLKSCFYEMPVTAVIFYSHHQTVFFSMTSTAILSYDLPFGSCFYEKYTYIHVTLGCARCTGIVLVTPQGTPNFDYHSRHLLWFSLISPRRIKHCCHVVHTGTLKIKLDIFCSTRYLPFLAVWILRLPIACLFN